MSLQRLACIPLLFIGVAAAGINWKSVWVEPRTPVVLTAGETISSSSSTRRIVWIGLLGIAWLIKYVV
jgi:hypothetical protein